MRILLLIVIIAGGLYGLSWWDGRQKEFSRAASEGRIVIGMSKAQLIEAVGQPQSISSRSDTFFVEERFTYENGPIVTVKNNRVAAVDMPERRVSREDTISWTDRSATGKPNGRGDTRAVNPTERDLRNKWGWPKGNSLSKGAYN